MQIDVGILISLLSVALAVGTFFLGRTSAAKSSGQQQGQVLTELGYIKRGVDGLERKMDEMQKNQSLLETRVSKLEQMMGFYHHE